MPRLERRTWLARSGRSGPAKNLPIHEWSRTSALEGAMTDLRVVIALDGEDHRYSVLLTGGEMAVMCKIVLAHSAMRDVLADVLADLRAKGLLADLST